MEKFEKIITIISLILLTGCEKPPAPHQISEKDGVQYVWIPGHWWPTQKLPEFNNRNELDEAK